ncbi:helix-turn-helix domain-containing protein [Paucilactobacillus suebicus]|uniref:AraC family transcriptional regulator n=1 Tax=Paucilactobacillus suebicus DSM 5007 = KCTC 3549 TaxID=1423807 RepID=A0A0R1W3M0_9LACO|nr:helix-turn-helix domain-containing protein [Paucilactobacillus suebicus]KRM12279.1 AraC family transcriptional regulator [Paucilactobacillus suebicus DSM 5007 = KCTC 3549]
MRRLEDFDNEYLFVLPEDTLKEYASSPIVTNLYVTDLGFFPNAEDHYVSRINGAPSWIIIFCTNGSGTVEVNGHKYAMHQNSLIILPPGIKHVYYASQGDPWDIYWVHFRGKIATDFMCVLRESAFYIDELPEANAKDLMGKFWTMIQTFIPGFSYARVIYVSQMVGAALASLSVIDSSDEEDNTTGSSYVDSAINYIYKHISEPIKLPELADQLDISTSYLSRSFHATVGTSVNQFITTTKMARASHYLQYTNVPIQQIAARLGYTDSYYFSRVFKKNFHVAPRNFRNQPNNDEIDK